MDHYWANPWHFSVSPQPHEAFPWSWLQSSTHSSSLWQSQLWGKKWECVPGPAAPAVPLHYLRLRRILMFCKLHVSPYSKLKNRRTKQAALSFPFPTPGFSVHCCCLSGFYPVFYSVTCILLREGQVEAGVLTVTTWLKEEPPVRSLGTVSSSCVCSVELGQHVPWPS